MIAIIAGTGSLPRQACKSLIRTKKNFFVLSLFPEDNLKELSELAHVVHKPFYKTKIILDELKSRGAKEVLFIGKVDKRNLLKKFKLDWFAVKALASIATKSDNSIMNKIGDLLEEHDIKVISQETILKTLFVPPGIVTGLNPAPELQKSIDMGIEIAKKISEWDIGQTVVVKDQMVLAIEAIEGTDACIARGIELGKTGIAVCKAAQPKHNKKFDCPTIGPDTIEKIPAGTVAAIAWLSDKTFIVDLEKLIKKANERGITLVSV